MPRAIAEVNAIRRSNQSHADAVASDGPSGIGHGGHGYDPSQPRVPAGHRDGGQWTKGAGGEAPGAPNREVVLDESGEEAWESVANTYRPDGTLAEQEVINRDGSRIVLQFSRDPRISGWDERHTVTLPDGRQITFENSGEVQTVYDAAGQPIAANERTGAGPEPHATMQLARMRPQRRSDPSARSAPSAGSGAGARETGPGLLDAAASAAAALFSWLSSQNSRHSTAVLAFKAGEYQEEGTEQKPRLEWVGRLTRDEVGKVCEKLEDVQDRTDEAVKQVRKDADHRDAADFGTKVHKLFAHGINDMKDPNYRAEVSYLKSKHVEVKYGVRGSIRVDAYENLPRISTVCVYDPKTGERGLSFPRMTEIARTIHRVFGRAAQRIIVTEVRPGQAD